MGTTIPLFPLKLVAFPGENLNLHIFEPRYKQLVKDCIGEHSGFGICVYTDRLLSHGTVVKLLEVYKEYDDGRMDIKTRGVRPFRIVTFENPMGDRLYAGGEVELLENDEKVSNDLYEEFIFYLKKMLKLLHAEVDLDARVIDSFTFAHQLGLKIEEEYQLLLMEKETDRMEFLTGHLKKMLPVVRGIEKARERIKMNGHFRSLDPLDF